MELAQLLVAPHEVLLVRELEKVGVEIGLILLVVTIVEFKNPSVPQRVDIADLGVVGIDIPVIRVVSVAALDNGPVRQIVHKISRESVTGARIGIDFRRVEVPACGRIEGVVLDA